MTPNPTYGGVERFPVRYCAVCSTILHGQKSKKDGICGMCARKKEEREG